MFQLWELFYISWWVQINVTTYKPTCSMSTDIWIAHNCCNCLVISFYKIQTFDMYIYFYLTRKIVYWSFNIFIRTWRFLTWSTQSQIKPPCRPNVLSIASQYSCRFPLLFPIACEYLPFIHNKYPQVQKAMTTRTFFLKKKKRKSWNY